MSTPLISDCASAQLDLLTVKVLPVKLFSGSGSAWNPGEFGLLYVELTNTTGVPLRDIYVKTQLWSSAVQYQSFMSWNGNGGYLGDLDVGETLNKYVALLKAIAPGHSIIFVYVSAEVVPYVSRSSPAYQLAEVFPA